MDMKYILQMKIELRELMYKGDMPDFSEENNKYI